MENLQTYLFYAFAQSEGLFGKEVESKVEVADMTVYLLLFYLSTLNNYQYSFHTSIDQLTTILETTPSVVENALKSLEEHNLIHYHNHDKELHLTIEPIKVNS